MHSLPAPSVLYVEDESLTAQAMMSDLRALGYEDIEHFRSWEELSPVLGARHYDVALLDIKLGDSEADLSGIEIGKLLELRYKLPIVYLTSYRESWVVERISTQPNARYTDKISPAEVIDVIIRIAHKSQSQTKNQVGSMAVAKLPKEVVFVPDGFRHWRLNFSELLYLRWEVKYTIAYVDIAGSIRPQPISLSVKEVVALFDRDDILQISKGTAVTLHAIVEVQRESVKLRDKKETTLKVGRDYLKTLRSALC